ncbi:MAG: hypothetical protein ACREQQ_05715 [Candidatus Binatia bacterium]
MPSEPTGVDPTIAYFGDLFSRLRVDWCIAGAVAANAYRPPRDTTDLDLVVQISASRYRDVAERLRADGWRIVRSSPESDYPDIVRLRHDVYFPTDLLLVKTAYQAEALARATPLATVRTGPRVLSAEDVIVHKLIANRHRDRADVHEILRSGVPLDREYVQRWAVEWDVVERWEAAVAESGN